jgi:hypothetical protein
MARKTGAAVSQAKDQPLPTMEDAGIPEIEEAGAVLLEARERYSNVGKEVNEKEAAVVTVMKNHDRTYYKRKGLEIEIKEGKVKAKVKHSASENDE